VEPTVVTVAAAVTVIAAGDVGSVGVVPPWQAARRSATTANVGSRRR
jgi:hypothetical protein